MAKIKIGLVGFGKHSAKIWLPILLSSENFTLSAISSEVVDSYIINSEINRITGGVHAPIELFSEHDSLLKSGDLECVVIATSNSVHGSQVLTALESNKHVFCEKPLCFQDEQIVRISELIKLSNLILETGFMYRFHPQWQFVKNYFEKVRHENWRILGQFQYNLPSKSNYRKASTEGGGALLDAGCYFLDICEFLNLSNPKNSRILNKTTESGVDENCIVDLTFSDEQHASFHCSIKQVRFQSFSIFAENSYIQLESPFILPKNKRALLLEQNEVGKIKQHFFNFTDCYSMELNNFAKLIRNPFGSAIKNSGLNNATWLANLRNVN